MTLTKRETKVIQVALDNELQRTTEILSNLAHNEKQAKDATLLRSLISELATISNKLAGNKVLTTDNPNYRKLEK